MDRFLVIHGQFVSETSTLAFISIDVETNECTVPTFQIDANNSFQVDAFFGRFDKIFCPKIVKAIVFFFRDDEFKSYATSYYFRDRLREYCQMYGIFYSFPTQDSLHMFGALIKTKMIVQEGDEVMFIRLRANPSTGRFNDVEGIIAVKKKNCYQFVRYLNRKKFAFAPQWKKSFLQNSKPKRVIIIRAITDPDDFVNGMQQVFKAENAVVYNFGMSLTVINEPIVDKVMHDMGEIISPYYISNVLLNNFYVKYCGKSLISITFDRALPLNESVIINVDPSKTVILSTDEPVYALINTIKLESFKCKKVMITLKIDINSFYDFSIAPFDENIPNSKLDKSEPCSMNFIKTRLTFDKQNFAVSIIENDKEKNIMNFDGLDKTPIYIAFTEVKPLVGKSAFEMSKDKPEFVVYDLIKLCSITSADIMNPNWKFNLSKEDDNIVVTMQTVEGKRKSSVEFLLAIILKNAFKIVKNEIGKKLKDVEIKFNEFVPNETLKKNFMEAGKLMNVNTVFL